MKIKNMRRMIAPLFVVFAMAGCTSVRVASDIEARQVAPVAEKCHDRNGYFYTNRGLRTRFSIVIHRLIRSKAQIPRYYRPKHK